MENNIDEGITEVGLRMTSKMIDFIITTTKWAKFLSIVGFVILGLMLIGALLMFGVAGSISGGGAIFGSQVLLMSFMYIGMALLYFFPTYYLFKFASKTKKGLMNLDSHSVESGFEYLKSTFKFMGILMIIVLSIYLFAILVAGIVGAAAL